MYESYGIFFSELDNGCHIQHPWIFVRAAKKLWPYKSNIKEYLIPVEEPTTGRKAIKPD
jgi:hypothetical protein